MNTQGNSDDVTQVNDPDLPVKEQGLQAAGSSNRRSSRSSSHSGKNASGAAVDKDAQRRGGQHSHGGR